MPEYMQVSQTTPPPVVVVVSSLIAHYREAVFRELFLSKRHHYMVAADIQDPMASGIRSWEIRNPNRFVRTRCLLLRGRYLIQQGLVLLALNRDISCIIYTGDAQYLTTWISAALARLSGKRVLFWTHGWIRRDVGPKRWIRITFYRLAHGLLLYGCRAKEIAIEEGFDAENVHVVYNSLDYEAQRTLREQITADQIKRLRAAMFPNPHRPMIIFVGRLTKAKRLDLLLEAMAMLRRESHEANLLLVGEGPQRTLLEHMAQAYDLSVKFFGECYAEEKLATLIMSANLTVIPDNAGLTVIHSLVYGTPVVTHNDAEQQGPEWEAIIPGLNGELFRHGDVSDLARVIYGWTQSEFADQDTRTRCYGVVDRFYNPAYQCRVIEQAVIGESPEDMCRDMTEEPYRSAVDAAVAGSTNSGSG